MAHKSLKEILAALNSQRQVEPGECMALWFGEKPTTVAGALSVIEQVAGLGDRDAYIPWGSSVRVIADDGSSYIAFYLSEEDEAKAS